jgi:hypothetical protein
MRILFDQGTPVPLRKVLRDHEVATVYELGWSHYQNGDLLRAAEEAGYETFVTTDQNLKYHQNLTHRKLAIVVILTPSWPKLKSYRTALAEVILACEEGAYVEYEPEG